MEWDKLTAVQKENKIAEYLDMESSIQDLQEDIMQIIRFNDLEDEWWASEESDTKEKEWIKLSQEQKFKTIEEELNDWDKVALIEFIIDHLTLQQIENFRYVIKL